MRLRVDDILEEADIDFRIIELCDRAVSVDDVIRFSKEAINPNEM